jgi:hypothetical protein
MGFVYHCAMSLKSCGLPFGSNHHAEADELHFILNPVLCGRTLRLRAMPAFLPTCGVRGLDLRRQQYVGFVEKLGK